MTDYNTTSKPYTVSLAVNFVLDALYPESNPLQVTPQESDVLEKARQFYCSTLKIDAKTCPTMFQLAVGHDSSIRFPAIYLDMDGTALGSDKQPLKETLKALDEFQKHGGRYGLASGRTLEQLRPYLTQLNPDLPIVLFNGGLTLSPADLKPIDQKNLDPASLSKIIDTMPAIEGVRTVFVHYRDSTIINRQDDGITKYKTKVGIIDTTLCEGAAFAKCVAEKNKKGELPIKVMLYTEWNSANAVAEKAKAALGGAAVVLVGSPETIEVLPHGVDKAVAIRAILPSFHLTADDVVVFGDSGNDARMLTEFPVSMAMGNCQKSACDAAAFKIGQNDQPTIAAVIERLVRKNGFRGESQRDPPPPLQGVSEAKGKMSADAAAMKVALEKKHDTSCTYAPAELGEVLTCSYDAHIPMSDATVELKGKFTLFVEGPTANSTDHNVLVRTRFKPRYDVACYHYPNSDAIVCDGAFYAYNFVYAPKEDKTYCHLEIMQHSHFVDGKWIEEGPPDWVRSTYNFLFTKCDVFAN